MFRRGQAELVEDPALIAAPLARPGEVIKRLRGTAAEQLTALGDVDDVPPARKRSRASAKPPRPRPSRATLDAAEQALAEAEARHEAATAALRRREAELARDRVALERSRAEDRERLQARRDEAEAASREAMRRWLA